MSFAYRFLHVTAVVILLGGGIFHTWILEPITDKTFQPMEAEKLKNTEGKIWGTTGLASFIIILITRILSTSRAGALNTESLFHTTFGKLILAKTVILAVGLIIFLMIGTLANGISKMMAADSPPPMETIHATAARIKMLANILSVGGVVAVALAVAMRLHG